MLLAGLGSVRVGRSYELGLENQCFPRPQPRATFSSPRSQLFSVIIGNFPEEVSERDETRWK